MQYQIKITNVFDKWFSSLKDKQAVNAINIRLIHFINGNFGDSKQLTKHLHEMRVFVGKGYLKIFGGLIHEQAIKRF